MSDELERTSDNSSGHRFVLLEDLPERAGITRVEAESLLQRGEIEGGYDGVSGELRGVYLSGAYDSADTGSHASSEQSAANDEGDDLSGPTWSMGWEED